MISTSKWTRTLTNEHNQEIKHVNHNQKVHFLFNSTWLSSNHKLVDVAHYGFIPTFQSPLNPFRWLSLCHPRSTPFPISYKFSMPTFQTSMHRVQTISFSLLLTFPRYVPLPPTYQCIRSYQVPLLVTMSVFEPS